MDFTDAFPLARSQHAYGYSPGSTFLVVVQHLADDSGYQQFGRSARRRPLASSSSSSSSSAAPAPAYGSSADGGRDGRSLRSVVQILLGATLQVVRSWTLAFPVSSVRWSQNGAKLLCASKDRLVTLIVDPHMAAVYCSRQQNFGSTAAHFFDVDDEGHADAASDCIYAFKAGAEGMASACWVGSDTVCTMSGDSLLATLHDTRTGEATVVSSTKTSSRCYTSPSQEFVAFLQRKDAADVVSIVRRCDPESAQAGWHVVSEFAAHSNDAVSLIWSPNELYVAVWEGALENSLLVYSVMGHLQARISIDALQPSTMFPPLTAHPNTPLPLSAGGLGIRDARWDPKGRFIAVGDYHDQLRLLETKEWCEFASFNMAKAASLRVSPRIRANMHAWREPAGWQQATGGRSIASFEPMDLPVALPVLKPDLDKLHPKAGVCWMEWNASGERLAVRSDSVPNAVFVLAVPRDCDGMRRVPYVASVVVLAAPIHHAVWRPRPLGAARDDRDDDQLAIVCQSAAVYFWRILKGVQSVEAIPVPIDDFFAAHLAFAPDGRTLTLASTTETFCCAMDAIEADQRSDTTCGSSLATPSHL